MKENTNFVSLLCPKLSKQGSWSRKLKSGKKLKPHSEKLFCIPSQMHFNLTELSDFEGVVSQACSTSCIKL